MKILYKSAKYFSATWCGPCKAFKPVMNEVAGEGYIVEFIDIDNRSDIATKYGIRSVPTVVIEQGGQEVSRFTGALSKQLVLERLA
jgi:thioredoxin 1